MSIRLPRGLRSCWLLFILPWRVAPGHTMVAWLGEGMGGAWYPWAALLISRIANAAAEGDTSTALGAAIALVLLASISTGLLVIGVRSRLRLGELLGAELELRLCALAVAPGTISQMERPDVRDRIEVLRGAIQAASFFAAIPPGLITAAILLSAGLALLASVAPIGLLLAPAAIPLAFARIAASNWTTKAREQAAVWARQQRHFLAVSTSAPGVREIHAFGAEQSILDEHSRIARQVTAIQTRAGWRGARVALIGQMAFLLTLGAVLATVFRDALRGDAGPGDVLMTVMLGTAMSDRMENLAFRIGLLHSATRTLSQFTWLADEARAAEAQMTSRDRPPPSQLRHGIDVRSLSFTYPGGTRPTLQDIDLFLPRGAVVAFVGPNGAGKTTLVKLLLGLYDPTWGAIAIDDVPLTSIRPDAWLERCTGAFQDFVRPEFSLGEAVGLGDVAVIENQALLQEALQRGGAGALPARLPAGLETQLGASWPAGVDLSGGEWQKVALGRGLVRADPILMVLDEPTAALDAESERDLFDRLSEASRQAATDRITLLVSHRLATVRTADLIIVLDGGRVVEKGKHGDLMATNGLYARLYRTQMDAYA